MSPDRDHQRQNQGDLFLELLCLVPGPLLILGLCVYAIVRAVS